MRHIHIGVLRIFVFFIYPWCVKVISFVASRLILSISDQRYQREQTRKLVWLLKLGPVIVLCQLSHLACPILDKQSR